VTPTRLEESYRFCADLSKREAKNFYYGFLLLPKRPRRSMCALYAFMRHTDDLADGPGAVAEKRQALAAWRRELDRAIETGTFSDWPGHPALVRTVHDHAIPPRLLHDVIDGVEMDLEPAPFPTFRELRTYCYRVASAVGLCCIHIWGYESNDGRAEELAIDYGLALQLTNIIRDVREDAEAGRVYLPMEDLERFGVTDADLARSEPNARLRDLLAFQADRATTYYDRARPLVKCVEPVGRPVLLAIVGLYRAILDEIRKRDYNVLASRVALPRWRKTAIMIGALRGIVR